MIPKNRKPTHPGEILLNEFMIPMGINQSELARHLKWTHSKVNELINGKRGITPESALALADTFETSPDLWINLQKNCDLWEAVQSHQKISKINKAA